MMELNEDITVEVIARSYQLHSQVYCDLHHREIRLVRLLEGQWPDQIQCRLEHAPLGNRPVYKSLSYAWGSPRATRIILVNGQRYSVTVNLESALRRLRKTDGDLIIWIDALCINQSNVQERTAQVTLMHDIYASAEEVIVYLGEGPHIGSKTKASINKTVFYNDDRDLHKLKEFSSCFKSSNSSRRRSRRLGMDSVTKTFCFLRILARELDFKHFPGFDSNSHKFIESKAWTEAVEGIRQLLLSRWWNRIWVIQEVVVSKTVTMVYGAASAPWGMFVDAAALWQPHNSSSPSPLQIPYEYYSVIAYFSKTILDIDLMRQRWISGTETTLLRLLRRFSGRKASDDRDKVYALLGLAKQKTTVVSDYSMTVAEVYQNAVLDSISHTRSLDALVGDLGRKERQDLPSWVTDWSAVYDDYGRRRAENAGEYRATGDCIVHVKNYGDKAWSELCGYIETCSTALDWSEYLFNQGDLAETFTRILGTNDWMEWLSDAGSQRASTTKGMYLTAINEFLTARGTAVCLENHGSGVIGLPGLHLDTIIATAGTEYSEIEFGSIFHSWAARVYKHFTSNSLDTSNLGDIFRKTLCADRIQTGSEIEGYVTRRVSENDHELITTWFVQGLGAHAEHLSHSPRSFWDVMFKSYGDPEEYIGRKETPPNVDDAIQLATQRRTLFTTKEGYIGLGPANLQTGDDIFLLMGGHTPFILRTGGPRKIYRKKRYPQLGYIERNCFQVVGDAYIHGFMDGEAMPRWRAAEKITKSDIKLQTLLDEWEENFQFWKDYVIDLSAWRAEITVEGLRAKLSSYGLIMTNEDLLWMTHLITEKGIYMSEPSLELAEWEDMFDKIGDIRLNRGFKHWTGWKTEVWNLIKRANSRMEQIEQDISSKEIRMGLIMQEVREIEKDFSIPKYIYLV